jgi:hypothetical protein
VPKPCCLEKTGRILPSNFLLQFQKTRVEPSCLQDFASAYMVVLYVSFLRGVLIYVDLVVRVNSKKPPHLWQKYVKPPKKIEITKTTTIAFICSNVH